MLKQLIIVLTFGFCGHSFASLELKSKVYTVEIPKNWKEAHLDMPDGAKAKSIISKNRGSRYAFCWIKLSELIGRAYTSDDDIFKFFASVDPVKMNKLIYSDLEFAPNYNFISGRVSTLSGKIPAFRSDFTYSVPDGYFYRVRQYYTFWPRNQLSLWCLGVARTRKDAELVFHEEHNGIQKIIHSLVIFR